MRRLILSLPLLALAACGTPQEQCINRAAQELRTLDRLIDQTAANLDRGFALETRQELVTRPRLCGGMTEDGQSITYQCERTETVDRQVPVAIDLNAERAKLASLRERRGQMAGEVQGQVAACRAAYPE
ncbi:hypothetical protein [Pseudoroseicyclus sp. CXY001]|uniref:hypothetical protein n=1 Tax=Pseudoroseicyclus sp. CXY001 TaxID=3242492 RepID=UPI003571674A